MNSDLQGDNTKKEMSITQVVLASAEVNGGLSENNSHLELNDPNQVVDSELFKSCMLNLKV